MPGRYTATVFTQHCGDTLWVQDTVGTVHNVPCTVHRTICVYTQRTLKHFQATPTTTTTTTPLVPFPPYHMSRLTLFSPVSGHLPFTTGISYVAYIPAPNRECVCMRVQCVCIYFDVSTVFRRCCVTFIRVTLGGNVLTKRPIYSCSLLDQLQYIKHVLTYLHAILGIYCNTVSCVVV